MKQYQGAVFFVDMLGVGALTQNLIPLDEQDFNAWRMETSPLPSANLFCGRLLTEFRSCLAKVKGSHRQVKIAQLSDCAYMWSDNVLDVLEAARTFMWGSVSAGLLSRGGLSYGEIVEPDKINRAIGQFVLGGAVTRAVGLEKAGKGCRVFIDDGILEHLLNLPGSPFKNGAVKSLKNPLDGSVVKEFCWYATGGKTADWKVEQHEGAKQILRLVTLLQYSPRFFWNEANFHGRIQLACSIDSISEITSDFIGNANYIFKGDDYLSEIQSMTGKKNRSNDLCRKVIVERSKDIERFFLDGKQHFSMDLWLERRLSQLPATD
ncbi:hypothetical protein [Pseudomonas sp. TWP3-2]|uniref:hypothetical protein n=1 Tax=Pseudomonas sp. TWP3-2 TaxID=2804574 RepID=UPI003CF8DBC6